MICQKATAVCKVTLKENQKCASINPVQVYNTFGRVVEASHLYCLECLTRLHLSLRRSNDGDLCHCGVEAGQKPAHMPGRFSSELEGIAFCSTTRKTTLSEDTVRSLGKVEVYQSTRRK